MGNSFRFRKNKNKNVKWQGFFFPTAHECITLAAPLAAREERTTVHAHEAGTISPGKVRNREVPTEPHSWPQIPLFNIRFILVVYILRLNSMETFNLILISSEKRSSQPVIPHRRARAMLL